MTIMFDPATARPAPPFRARDGWGCDACAYLDCAPQLLPSAALARSIREIREEAGRTAPWLIALALAVLAFDTAPNAAGHTAVPEIEQTAVALTAAKTEFTP